MRISILPIQNWIKKTTVLTMLCLGFMVMNLPQASAQSKPQKALDLVHQESTITVEVQSLADFFVGIDQFMHKGLGAVGTMFMQRLKDGSKKQFGADIFSTTGLYMAGLNPNASAATAFFIEKKDNKQ